MTLFLIFCAALSGTINFEPDWPPLFPIDAFELREGSDWTSIEITFPVETEPEQAENNEADGAQAAGSPDLSGAAQTGAAQTGADAAKNNGEQAAESSAAAGAEGEEQNKTRTLRAVKFSYGLLKEFPYWDGKDFFQIEVELKQGAISALNCVCDAVEIKAEVLETTESDFFYPEADSAPSTNTAAYNLLPSILRVNINGVYSFVSFSYNQREVIETWFDEAGVAQKVMIITMREENRSACSSVITNGLEGSSVIRFDYDNSGNKTGVQKENAAYSALFGINGLKYLGVQKETDVYYSYQKDERGIFTRAQIALINRNTNENEVQYHSYSYIFDERGNWTSREQTNLTEQFGVLLPSDGGVIQRKIEYAK
ncbi:MAG: hypothetical protein LBG79_05510 [Spirochaetaceae bacterium]|jgi:hypothetical protein|nr:hypothetical protein [Spirochaetaceae bacterium]